MSRYLPKLIVILGPTASGKTEMALKLAKRFGGEIVNADSRQIYRSMDIGTGKIKADKRGLYRGFTRITAKGVLHWLIDIVDPDEEFTVAQYKKMAVRVIRDILKRGKLPFLVGGTGFYIQAVMDNLFIPHVPPNKKLRAEFERDIKKARCHFEPIASKQQHDKNKKQKVIKVIEKWYKKLLKLDPEAIHIVDPKNPRRIIRAIEVCLATGQPFSKLKVKGKPLFDALQIGIDVPRRKLYQKIDRRVDKMIKGGLINETKKLLQRYNISLPSMSGIGYKEIGNYLDEELIIKNRKLKKKLLADKVQKIKYRTHAYARRQMTWFRRDRRIKWIKNYKEAEKRIVEWLNC